MPLLFSVGRETAWEIFRFGPKYPQAYPDEQFPLAAQSELWKQMVPDWSASLGEPNPTVLGLGELSRRLHRAILVSHSQSGVYPFEVVKRSREGVDGVIAIEPLDCPKATGDLAAYTHLPILIIYGDHVDQSANWSPRLAGCQAFIEAVNKVSGAQPTRAELIVLPKIGIHGNSHMMMQDRNNLVIADLIAAWIRRVGLR